MFNFRKFFGLNANTTNRPTRRLRRQWQCEPLESRAMLASVTGAELADSFESGDVSAWGAANERLLNGTVVKRDRSNIGVLGNLRNDVALPVLPILDLSRLSPTN